MKQILLLFKCRQMICIYVILFFGSCKKITDIVRVLEITRDYSSSDLNNVSIIDYYNNNLIVSDSNKIKLSINGGDLKNVLSPDGDSIFDLKFLGEQTIALLTDNPIMGNGTDHHKLYFSYNNGVNWTYINKSNAVFTWNNKTYYTKTNTGIGGQNKLEIRSSTDNVNFQIQETLPYTPPSIGYDKRDVNILFEDSLLKFYNKTDDIFAYCDPLNFQVVKNITLDNNTTYFHPDVSGSPVYCGQLGYRSMFPEYNISYNLYSLAYNSFGQSTIVGENIIFSNNNQKNPNDFSMILDKNGLSFPHTFYKILHILENYYYVGGSDGLIWKMKIY